MGLFHCVPNGCATVRYQEYLPPIIRYRYPGEDWQEVEGDDYSLETAIDCPGVPHEVIYSWLDIQGNRWECHNTGKSHTLPVEREWQGHTDAPFTDIYVTANGVSVEYFNSPENVAGFSRYFCHHKRWWLHFTDSSGTQRKVIGTYARGIRIDYFGVVPGYENQCSQKCTLRIFNQGQKVYEEKRDICPEVEQLPCRLDERVKTVKANKDPYLQRVDVVNYAWENFGLNVYRGNIPDECLNIYVNQTTAIPPTGFLPTNAYRGEYEPVIQICSAPGCPPPEYEVICDCEDCPDGTCKVICGDRYCCYNAEGISVKEINL